MGRLSAFVEVEQSSFDDIDFVTGGNGLCPNRVLCMLHRLNVSLDALEGGYKCAFEEHGMLWQCHLSGVPKPVEEVEHGHI